MDNLPDSVRARMGKLLALGTDNQNEHEASVAMEKLHVLLAEHNVSLGAIGNQDESDKAIQESSFVVEYTPWIRSVVYCIAELYFCDTWSRRGKRQPWKAAMFIVGTDTNRKYAASIIQNVIKAVNKEAHAGAKRADGSMNWSYATAFKYGASRRICQRCKDLIKKAKEGNMKSETGNSLVLADIYDTQQALVDDFMNDYHPGMGTEKAPRPVLIRDGEAYEAGQAHGDRAQINTGIGSA